MLYNDKGEVISPTKEFGNGPVPQWNCRRCKRVISEKSAHLAYNVQEDEPL